LLSGRAGVGYMLINLLKEGDMKSVIHMTLPEGVHTSITCYTKEYVTDKLFSKYYQRTCAMLEKRPSAAAADIPDYEQALAKIVNEAEDPVIESVFLYEQCLRSIWQQHKGSLCYYKLNDYLGKAAMSFTSFSHDTLLSLQYVRARHVHLVYAAFNPDAGEMEEGRFAVMIQSDSAGVKATVVRRITELIVSRLNERCTGSVLTDRILQEVFPLFTDEHEMLREKILLQLKELVHSRIVAYIQEGCSH